ncbi:MAG TPA: hypothetical protein ENK73_08190 [Thiomicrospira sp.]|nr:hypothetical protein [Thiomicrospira sp.]
MAISLFLFSTVAYSKTYECYRYVDGKPTGTWIKVKADSKSEATSKAYQRYDELGVKVDSVNCKYAAG